MKRFSLILFAAVPVLWSVGCSCVSKVERADFTAAGVREEYINLHPEGPFNECIRNGEIVAGMTAHEVMASWGMPNVYALSRSQPSEQWIYYTKDRESLSMLIYTLSFTEDTLRVWDIDQKRFVGPGIVSYDEPDAAVPVPLPLNSKKR